MEIKILGTGCPKCKALEKSTQEVVDKLGLDVKIQKVEDIMKIMEYGIMRTPGLVVNEKVVASGRSLSLTEIEKLITQNK